MKKIIFSIICILCCSFGINAKETNLLENSLTIEQLKTALLQTEQWINYPSYKDRSEWDRRIPSDIRENIIKEGEKALSYQWKPDLATDYLAYKRNGQILTGRKNQMTLNTLLLAELVEGKGRFIDAIINGAWFLCEVSWVHSAHAYFQKDQSGLPDPEEPTVELVVADIGAQMAWIYYFLHEELDKVSPLIAKRIKNTVYERLINPYYARTDYWWMGFTGREVNNWNIWINYNMLQAVLLLENDPSDKAKYIFQLMRSVDYYIDVQNPDGACEEGPSYFGHAGANLIKFLDLLDRATGGKVNIFSNEKIKNIGSYIRRVNINDQYFVNFSDAAARCFVSPGAVYLYGKRINDRQLMGFASDFARNNDWKNKLHTGSLFARLLDDVLDAQEILDGEGASIEELSYYFEDSQLAVARDSRQSDKGFYFAAHGSNNGVPHNHNDVGSCMLYFNGKPVLIDVGVGVYTKKTFSSERYSIWTMQSGYHNLPTINGVDQHDGKQYRAKDVRFSDKGRNVFFSADIASAYPKEAGVSSWIRSYTLKRNREFIVSDQWKLEKLNDNSQQILNFMTVCTPEVKDGCLLLKHSDFTLKMKFDNDVFKPTVETIPLNDKNLTSNWKMTHIYRIRLNVIKPSITGKTQVIVSKAD